MPLEICPVLTEREPPFLFSGVLLAAILDGASIGQARNPSTRTIECPDCGLILCVSDDAPGLHYDMRDWRRICTRVRLGGPAWCLICCHRRRYDQFNHEHPAYLGRKLNAERRCIFIGGIDPGLLRHAGGGEMSGVGGSRGVCREIKRGGFDPMRTRSTYGPRWRAKNFHSS